MKYLIRLAADGDKVPPKEIILIPYGVFKTLKGDFTLTRDGAKEVMHRYMAHGVDFSIDYEHAGLDPPADGAPASGWAGLELRKDGIYLVNIKWTKRARQYLKEGEYRYLSPVFNVDDKGEITELISAALTNLPATDFQVPLVAASRKGVHIMKHPLAHHLKEHAGRMGHEAFAQHLGWDSEKLSKAIDGGDVSHEEMKHACMKMGIEDSDIEASLDGMDVNKSQLSEDEPHGLGHLFEMVADESSETPNGSGEASEDQHGALHASSRKGGSKKANAMLNALVKLTGTSDPEALTEMFISLKNKADANEQASETLQELRRKIEADYRKQLIEANRNKLTPKLIALYRERPVKELKAFLDAAEPVDREFQEPNPQATTEGSRMVALTREEKILCKTTRTDEKVFAAHKETLVPDEVVSCGRRTPLPDNAPQSDWERTYRNHVQALSMFGESDGKPWKPANGSRLIITSRNGE